MFEMSTHSLSGEGLVGDVLKGTGDLGSILSLPSGQEVGGMVDVERGKLGGVVSRGCRKFREMSLAVSGDSSTTNTSRLLDLLGRMACFELLLNDAGD